MVLIGRDPPEWDQEHSMGSGWDFETAAMRSVEISADDLLHCVLA